MTIEEIKKRESKLNEELEKLSEMKAKLEQEKFSKKIGKYFRFNLESKYKGYIKIVDLYKLSDNYVIDCVWFGYDTSKARYYNYFSYKPYRKITIDNKVRSWNDFHLTEISEKDFKDAFNKALKEEQNIFSSFIDE